MSIFETVCTEERQQSLALSSVEGEELRAGGMGLGALAKAKEIICHSNLQHIPCCLGIYKSAGEILVEVTGINCIFAFPSLSHSPPTDAHTQISIGINVTLKFHCGYQHHLSPNITLPYEHLSIPPQFPGHIERL